MGTLYRTKSNNYWTGAAVGGNVQWIHIDAGNTGRTTIVPANVNGTSTPGNSTSGAIKPLILQTITINNTSSGSGCTFTDSLRGIIANMKAAISEKDYHYYLPLRGSLLIDNPGAADLTITYVRD
jgi:hypothetical protein